MFINKAPDGGNNISGPKIAALRKQLHISQRELAEELQLRGLDIDKNAIQRIESRQRFITDIELQIFAAFFKITIDELICSK